MPGLDDRAGRAPWTEPQNEASMAESPDMSHYPGILPAGSDEVARSGHGTNPLPAWRLGGSVLMIPSEQFAHRIHELPTGKWLRQDRHVGGQVGARGLTLVLDVQNRQCR
jgi:hypothetical protein